MENKLDNKKCSIKAHENPATYYCKECKIYICGKCEIHHSKLFEDNHHLFKLEKNKAIFTGFCNEPKHNEQLEFFCKTHNILCCSSCLCKIKTKEKGNHSDCDICLIDEIKNEKKNSLKENIKYLEEISNSLVDLNKKIKASFNNINEKKENLKLKITKIFTKLRNALNEKEDEFLLEIENEFDKLPINEKLIKIGEHLPKKIKESLEEGKKIIDKEWDDEKKLIELIFGSINIENNINDIKKLNDNLKKIDIIDKFKSKFDEKNYYNETINLLKIIKSFGKKDVSQILTELKEDFQEIENIVKDAKSDPQKFISSLINFKLCFSIRTRCNDNFCVDIDWGPVREKSHLWEYNDNIHYNQFFVLIKNDDNTYFIKNSCFGMYLSISSGDIIRTHKTGKSEKFKIIPYDGYFILENINGKVIDLNEKNAYNGVGLVMKDKNYSITQQWKLVVHSTLLFEKLNI